MICSFGSDSPALNSHSFNYLSVPPLINRFRGALDSLDSFYPLLSWGVSSINGAQLFHWHFLHGRQNCRSSTGHPFCCKWLCRFCHRLFQQLESTRTHKAPMLCSWLSYRVPPNKSSFASLRSDLCATLWLFCHSRRRRQQIQTWDEPTRLARRDPSVLGKFWTLSCEPSAQREMNWSNPLLSHETSSVP
jgi:hypothetical protein